MTINWKNAIHDTAILAIAVAAIIAVRQGLHYERSKPPTEPLIVAVQPKPIIVPVPAPSKVTEAPKSRLVRRIPVSPFCAAVKAFVAQNGQTNVENRARELGYSDAQIAAAKRCLGGQRR